MLLLRCISIAAVLLSQPAFAQRYGEIQNKSINIVDPNIYKMGQNVVLKDEYPFLLLKIEYPSSITDAAIRAQIARTRAYHSEQ